MLVVISNPGNKEGEGGEEKENNTRDHSTLQRMHIVTPIPHNNNKKRLTKHFKEEEKKEIICKQFKPKGFFFADLFFFNQKHYGQILFKPN